jgi:P27 family predicted phage terminase small subunit
MTKGRKRIPDEIKRIRGTIKPSRVNETVPDMVIDRLPPAPLMLNKHGKKVYKTIGQYLLNVKVLNEVNLAMFAAFCREYGVYWEAEESMINISDRWEKVTDSLGNFRTSPNAKHTISKESLRNALKIAVEFGLTPASISKIVFEKPKKKGIEDII